MPPLTQFIKCYAVRSYRVKCCSCGKQLEDGDEARFEQFDLGWKISHASCLAYEDRSVPAAREKKAAASDMERSDKMRRDWVEKRDAGLLPCAHRYETTEV
jgi:hypothetical protein